MTSPVGRMWSRIRGSVDKFLGVGSITGTTSRTATVPAVAPYPVARAMSALARNPTFFTSVQAIATDLVGLPLVVERGDGPNRTQVPNHWFLRLLKRPNLKVRGKRFRKQLIADMRTAGVAYVRVWRNPSGQPYQLARIHPAAIDPLVGADMEVLGYRFHDGKELAFGDVLAFADISYEDRESMVLGTSVTRPLSLGMQVDEDMRIHTGRAAKRGRVEVIGAPVNENTGLGPQRIEALQDSYAETMEAGLGLWVASAAIKLDVASLSARDAEFLGMSDRNRAEILGCMGVPPVRAGDPVANYGTAKQQMRTYWENLQGFVSIIDDEFSSLLAPDETFRHDFSRVEALQTATTERLDRVIKWVSLGMDPNEAARYEQFVDAPNCDPAKVKPTGAASDKPAPSDFQADEPAAAKSERVRDLLLDAANEAGWNTPRGPMLHSMLAARLVPELGSERAAEVAREFAEDLADRDQSIDDLDIYRCEAAK